MPPKSADVILLQLDTTIPYLINNLLTALTGTSTQNHSSNSRALTSINAAISLLSNAIFTLGLAPADASPNPKKARLREELRALEVKALEQAAVNKGLSSDLESVIRQNQGVIEDIRAYIREDDETWNGGVTCGKVVKEIKGKERDSIEDDAKCANLSPEVRGWE